jgi:hypothetical protein
LGCISVDQQFIKFDHHSVSVFAIKTNHPLFSPFFLKGVYSKVHGTDRPAIHVNVEVLSGSVGILFIPASLSAQFI